MKKLLIKLFLTFSLLISVIYLSNGQSYTASVGTRNSGSISKQELIDAGRIIISEPNSEISSFRMTRVRKNEPLVELDNAQNGEITDAMKELISNSLSGDKIYFEYIKCRAGDGTIRSLESMSFIID